MVGNSVWWLVDSGDKYGGCDKVESLLITCYHSPTKKKKPPKYVSYHA